MGNALISTADVYAVNFAPSTEVEEVIQNVRTIINTVKQSVPLDRSFGIDGDVVDKPMPVAEAQLANEIFTAVKRYEPRARIENIRCKSDLTGKLRVEVVVSI